MYEIIDETLKLASCCISDLTIEEASAILSRWEDGSRLGSLTMFYNPKSEYLVLNKDNERYDFYLELAKTYLSANDKVVEKYRDKFSDGLQETLIVMDNFRERNRIQSDLNMIDHQYLDASEDNVTRSVLKSLENKQIPTCFLMLQAYSYGVMNGKRMERARRKAVAV